MRLIAESAEKTVIVSSLFGGNILINRDQLGESGTYDELAEELGITGVRYPGGSITEFYFDINDPNRTIGVHPQTQEERNLIPYDEFLSWSSQQGLPVTVVLPTRGSFNDKVDRNGDRYPSFNKEDLSNFVRNTIQKISEYPDLQIQAFEIGNEYWGSGEMTSVEYGRLSSEMALVIDNTLKALNHDATSIVVQVGTNFNRADLSSNFEYLGSGAEKLKAIETKYSLDLPSDEFIKPNGEINWTKIANELIINEFNQGELATVDGVAAHLYSRGVNNSGTRDFALRSIENSWLEAKPEADIFITEWNQKSNTPLLSADRDFGLKQAAEMLTILDVMSDYGVDVAHIWPLQENTKNALSLGFEFDELTPPGEMFKMMRENLPGKIEVKINSKYAQKDQELNLLGFYGDDDFVLYVISEQANSSSNDIDISNIIRDFGDVEITRLGVKSGQEPGSTVSEAVVEKLSEDEYLEDGKTIQADLMGFEIMQVVFSDALLTSEVYEIIRGSPETTPEKEEIIEQVETEHPDLVASLEAVLGSFMALVTIAYFI